jgi:protein-L-isoaspartate O-methyltransferase
MTGPDPGALKRLMAEISKDTSRTAGETGLSELSPSVLRAMMDVPRQEFVPAGEAGGHQMLMRIAKSEDGEFEEELVLSVAFVPLVED